MLKYKIIQQEAKLGKYAGQQIQRAQQVLSGTVSFTQFCRVLAKKSALSEGDVRALMFELPDTITEFMELGVSVDCGELGKFRPTFGSKQIPVGTEFTHDDLKSPRITFVPRQKFKEFKSRVSFERVSADDKCKAPNKNNEENEEEYNPSGHTGL